MGSQVSRERKFGGSLNNLDTVDGMDVATVLPRALAFGAQIHCLIGQRPADRFELWEAPQRSSWRHVGSPAPRSCGLCLRGPRAQSSPSWHGPSRARRPAGACRVGRGQPVSRHRVEPPRQRSLGQAAGRRRHRRPRTRQALLRTTAGLSPPARLRKSRRETKTTSDGHHQPQHRHRR